MTPFQLAQEDLTYVIEKSRPALEKFRNSTVLLTGATGFIGTWILESLVHADRVLKLNIKLLVLVRNPAKWRSQFSRFQQTTCVEVVEGDITNFSLTGYKLNHIIHLAVPTQSESNTILPAMKHVLEVARVHPLCSVLFSSSGAIYGADTAEKPPLSEDDVSMIAETDRHFAYAEGKRAAEKLAEKYYQEFGPETKIARCFSFSGPHLSLDAHYAFGNFIRDGLNKRTIQVAGDGSPLRSYMYPTDLVVWLLQILMFGHSCRPYNVGSEESISISELAKKIGKACGVGVEIQNPRRMVAPSSRYVPSTKRARKELGLSLGVTLVESIQKTLDWHKKKNADCPKVSVCVFGYNQAKYVREAVESVLSQTYENIEILLLDNGSTDNSQEILSEYQVKFPDIKLIFNKKNECPTNFCSRGVNAATGDFISILYADDYYLPEKVEKQVNSFRKLGPEYGMVYSAGHRLNEQTGEKWIHPTFRESGDVLKRMFELYPVQGMIIPISPLIRKECFEKYPFRVGTYTEGDDIFFRFALSFNFFFLDVPLVVMRDHHSNMGKAIKLNSINFLDCISRLQNEPELTKEERKALSTYVAKTFRNYAWQGFRVLQDKTFIQSSLSTVIKWDIKEFFHPKVFFALVTLVIPKGFFRVFNALLYRLHPTKVVVAVKESYV